MALVEDRRTGDLDATHPGISTLRMFPDNSNSNSNSDSHPLRGSRESPLGQERRIFTVNLHIIGPPYSIDNKWDG